MSIKKLHTHTHTHTHTYTEREREREREGGSIVVCFTTATQSKQARILFLSPNTPFCRSVLAVDPKPV